MRRLPYYLLALLCLFLQPVGAQDDEEPEIEIGEDPPPEEESGGNKPPVDKTKKFGGGKDGPRDDVEAPKLKLPLQKRVNLAIAAGVKWLKKRHEKGYWGSVKASQQYGGKKLKEPHFRDELAPSAWAVYALAKCDVKKSDPAIKAGLKFLFDETEFMWDETPVGQGKFGGSPKLQKASRKTPRTTTTYENAALILMIEAVFQRSAKLTGKHTKRTLFTDNALKPPARSKIPKKIWKYMHRRIEFLTTGRSRSAGSRSKSKGGWTEGLQVTQGPSKGGWRYAPGQQGADLSATQFALLALRAASQAGYPVELIPPSPKAGKNKDGVWLAAAKYVLKCQDKGTGGFRYQVSPGKVTGAMTGCGVGCLLICKEQMLLARSRDPEAPAPPTEIDKAIQKGMDWLDKNFDANKNPGGNHHYYYLYGVERVGDLAGRKEFNGKDWYVRGAEFLLSHQDPDGKWMDATEAFPPRDVNSTTLALLFLKRATPPAVTFTGD